MSTFLGGTSDEAILTQDICLRMWGPLGHTGVLTLSARRLRFVPTAWLDRLAGARDLHIDVSEIREVQLGGLTSTMSVHLRDSVEKFSGAGAKRVYARLKSLIDERSFEDDEQIEKLAFGPGERILVQGRAVVALPEGEASRCELLLTDRRIRFADSNALDALLSDEAIAEIPVVQIQGFRVSSVPPQLELDGPSGQYTIRGSLLPLLKTALDTLIQNSSSVIPLDAERVLAIWPSAAQAGGKSQAGDLHITPSRLRFIPDGSLSQGLGQGGFELAFGEIIKVEVGGWRALQKDGWVTPDRRIEITTHSASISLSVPQAIVRFRDLIPLVANARPSIAIPGLGATFITDTTGEGIASGESLLMPWRNELRIRDDVVVRMVGSALIWKSDVRVEFGWLIVTESHLFFLPPSESVTPTEPLRMRLSHLNRARLGEALTEQLLFTYRDDEYRFSPRGGAQMIEAFWAHCATGPSRLVDVSEDVGPLSRIDGEVLFIRMLEDDRTVHETAPASVLERGDGFGLIVDSIPKPIQQAGKPLTVEIGLPEGLYQFKTEVLRWGRAPALPQGQATANTGTHGPAPHRPLPDALLVVALPDEVRFFNRRDGFRVDTTLPVRIQALATGAEGSWIPAGPSQRCFLENLSIGGCSLVTEEPLPTLGRIAIDLPLGSHPLRLHGESVHIDEPKTPGDPWRYGVSFLEVSVPMEDRIHKELLRRQRANLVERSETFDEE